MKHFFILIFVLLKFSEVPAPPPPPPFQNPAYATASSLPIVLIQPDGKLGKRFVLVWLDRRRVTGSYDQTNKLHCCNTTRISGKYKAYKSHIAGTIKYFNITVMRKQPPHKGEMFKQP